MYPGQGGRPGDDPVLQHPPGQNTGYGRPLRQSFPSNVEEARYDALVAEDGKLLVRARYGIRNNQRTFLAVALPPNATLWSADDAAREAARRRLGVIRDALHAQSTPRFGRREGTVSQPPTADEHYRKLLGLPLDQRLNAPEIHRAFKRAAKAVHPDAGGDTQAFLELAAARDALMKHGIRYR